jgi:SAM-dependent methyltransferase
MFLREDEEGNHIAPHLEAGQTLLDLGAGTGFMARWLKRQTGVKPTLTDVVDYHNRDLSLPFIKQDDPFRVPVEDGSFDVVLLMFVFHHIEPYESQLPLLDEAIRIARRRLIILEDTPATGVDRAFNTFWDWLLNWRHGVPTPFTFRSADEWLEVFKARNLSIGAVDVYRPMWPTLKTYPHTLFALDR